MSFLLFNGWRRPVANGSAKMMAQQFGELPEAWTNRKNRARRGLPVKYDVILTPTLQAEADTMECLLSGRAHHFSCDVDAFSDAGLGPDTVGSGNYSIAFRTPTAGMYGTGYLVVATSIVWDVNLRPDAWTVAYWRNVTTTPQHIMIRSDGAKFINGVRNDTLSTVESVVAAGGFALTAGSYDDITVLPVPAADSFLAAMYRWAIGKGLKFYAPLDTPPREDFFGVVANPTTTGAVTTVRGKIAQGAQVTIAGRVQYAAHTNNSCNGNTEVSIEVWFWIDPTFVNGTDSIISKGPAGQGYAISLQNTGTVTGTSGMSFKMANNGATLTGAPLTIGAWNHVALAWDQATNTTAVYVNGVLNTTFTNGVAGGAVVNDSADTLNLFQTVAAGQQFLGIIDDFRFYARKLTALEVTDHYQAGLAGIAPPVPQPFSPLPYLEVDGAMTGWRQTQVLPEDASANLVQVGSNTGWLNNSRLPQITLEERQAFTPAEGPLPYAQWLMDERYFEGSALAPSVGNTGTSTFSVFAPTIVPGPFRNGRALACTTPGVNQLNPPTALAQALGGMRAFSFTAWVRRAATGTTHPIISLLIAAGTYRYCLRVLNTDTIQVRAKSNTADADQVITSVFTLTDTTRFHLVAGCVDVFNDRMAVTLDDTGYLSGAVGFAVTEVSTEFNAAGGNRFGHDDVGANHWNNEIAAVTLYNRFLTRGEVNQIYRMGLRGIVR